MYVAGKGLKHAERDVYTEGCLPGTGVMMDIDITFVAHTQAYLLRQMQDFYGVDSDAMMLNACDEPGRVDIQIMETDDAMPADEHDIALWKKGQKRLWLCTYTHQVYRQEEIVL